MRHPIQDRTAPRFPARNFLPRCAGIPRHAAGNKSRWIALPLLFLTAGLILAHPCAGAPFAFEYTGSLSTARSGYTATLLQNGKVLVAGGYNSTDYRHALPHRFGDRKAEAFTQRFLQDHRGSRLQRIN
jgi:hypothetical protein